MKKNIYKYTLEVTDKQRIELYRQSEILSIQEQNGVLCMWVLCDVEFVKDVRTFEIFGTGHNIDYDMGVDRKFISTFQMQGGAFVGHVFERLN